MNNFFPFLDIIILGLLAIFLGFRLKGLLGDRSGFSENLHNNDALKENKEKNDNIIKLNQKKISGEGLDLLMKADPLFDEKEFLKETESTFKLGIKHSDWHTIGKSFYSPIGDTYHNETRYPHISYDDFRIYHIADKLDYDKTFQSRLMAENRLHFSVQNDNEAEPS